MLPSGKPVAPTSNISRKYQIQKTLHMSQVSLPDSSSLPQETLTKVAPPSNTKDDTMNRQVEGNIEGGGGTVTQVTGDSLNREVVATKCEEDKQIEPVSGRPSGNKKRRLSSSEVGIPFEDISSLQWRNEQFFEEYACAKFTDFRVCFIFDERKEENHILLLKKLRGVAAKEAQASIAMTERTGVEDPNKKRPSCMSWTIKEAQELVDIIEPLFEEIEKHAGSHELLPSLFKSSIAGNLTEPLKDSFWSDPSILSYTKNMRTRIRACREHDFTHSIKVNIPIDEATRKRYPSWIGPLMSFAKGEVRMFLETMKGLIKSCKTQ